MAPLKDFMYAPDACAPIKFSAPSKKAFPGPIREKNAGSLCTMEYVRKRHFIFLLSEKIIPRLLLFYSYCPVSYTHLYLSNVIMSWSSPVTGYFVAANYISNGVVSLSLIHILLIISFPATNYYR